MNLENMRLIMFGPLDEKYAMTGARTAPVSVSGLVKYPYANLTVERNPKHTKKTALLYKCRKMVIRLKNIYLVELR